MTRKSGILLSLKKVACPKSLSTRIHVVDGSTGRSVAACVRGVKKLSGVHVGLVPVDRRARVVFSRVVLELVAVDP